MRPPALDAFMASVRADDSLQQRLRAVASLQELVALAQERGHALNPLQLQLWAHSPCFDGPWWPWAGEDGANKRVAFFRGAT
jgi:hypothetical protein